MTSVVRLRDRRLVVAWVVEQSSNVCGASACVSRYSEMRRQRSCSVFVAAPYGLMADGVCSMVYGG